MGNTYIKGTGLNVELYVDTEYASEATDSRSVSGGAVMWGGEPVARFFMDPEMRSIFHHISRFVAMTEGLKLKIAAVK